MGRTYFCKAIRIVLSAVMVFSSLGGYARAADLPIPGTPLFTSPAFNPLALKGLILDPDNPLRFHFIVDEGNNKFSDSELKDQTQALLNYFLAALALPESQIWVNLSPYEQDRIIPDKLGTTQMGKELLGQDYILKQLAASLTHPDTELGKKYWEAINNPVIARSVATKQSQTEITTPRNNSARNDATQSFNKVWIIPDKAVVYQDKDRVYIGEAHLKVMMESDYVALNNYKLQITNSELDNDHVGARHASPVAPNAINRVSTSSDNAFKTQILPVIEQEVNTGKNFASLRQIYHSLILAIWFKKALKETILYKAYADKQNTKGIDTIPIAEKNKIYDRYLEAFQKGAYNLVKRECVPANGDGSHGKGTVLRTVPISGKITRHAYFSGGFSAEGTDAALEERPVEALPAPSGVQRVVSTQIQNPAAQRKQELASRLINIYAGIDHPKIKLEAFKNLAVRLLQLNKKNVSIRQGQVSSKINWPDALSRFQTLAQEGLVEAVDLSEVRLKVGLDQVARRILEIFGNDAAEIFAILQKSQAEEDTLTSFRLITLFTDMSQCGDPNAWKALEKLVDSVEKGKINPAVVSLDLLNPLVKEVVIVPVTMSQLCDELYYTGKNMRNATLDAASINIVEQRIIKKLQPENTALVIPSANDLAVVELEQLAGQAPEVINHSLSVAFERRQLFTHQNRKKLVALASIAEYNPQLLTIVCRLLGQDMLTADNAGDVAEGLCAASRTPLLLAAIERYLEKGWVTKDSVTALGKFILTHRDAESGPVLTVISVSLGGPLGMMVGGGISHGDYALHGAAAGILSLGIALWLAYHNKIGREKIPYKLLELSQNGQIHPLAAHWQVIPPDVVLKKYLKFARKHLTADKTTEEIIALLSEEYDLDPDDVRTTIESAGAAMALPAVRTPRPLPRTPSPAQRLTPTAGVSTTSVQPAQEIEDGGIKIDTTKMDLQSKGEDIHLNPQQLSSIPDFTDGAVLHIIKVCRVSDVKAMMCAGI